MLSLNKENESDVTKSVLEFHYDINNEYSTGYLFSATAR